MGETEIAWREELEAIVHRIDRLMPIYGTEFPHLAWNGRYSEQLTVEGSWTGSFWTGMVYLAARITGERKYIDYLLDYLPVYDKRLNEGWLDHDTGFLFQLYAVPLYRATGDQRARDQVVRAAEELLKRFNPRGGFIRAWGRLDDPERAGKMIIDCLLNLPLLHSATALTGNPAYAAAAERHVRNAARYQIRADGSTHHTFDFEPDKGEPIGGFNEGGYDDESCWSRGQAWGIYGFALAYAQTGDRLYVEAARRLADYWLDELPEDGIPSWDFRLPTGSASLRDSSAAAIAACGMFELHAALRESENGGDRYRSCAIRMLEALRLGYSTARGDESEAMLNGVFGRVGGVEYELNAIWGDYFYMEALLLACGERPNMWTSTDGGF